MSDDLLGVVVLISLSNFAHSPPPTSPPSVSSCPGVSPGNVYKIINKQYGCLADNGGWATAPGSWILGYADGNSANQYWYIQKIQSTNDAYLIINKGVDVVMDIVSNFTTIQNPTCEYCQQFSLQPGPNGTCYIYLNSIWTNAVLTHQYLPSCTTVQQLTWSLMSNTPDQQWTFQFVQSFSQTFFPACASSATLNTTRCYDPPTTTSGTTKTSTFVSSTTSTLLPITTTTTTTMIPTTSTTTSTQMPTTTTTTTAIPTTTTTTIIPTTSTTTSTVIPTTSTTTLLPTSMTTTTAMSTTTTTTMIPTTSTTSSTALETTSTTTTRFSTTTAILTTTSTMISTSSTTSSAPIHTSSEATTLLSSSSIRTTEIPTTVATTSVTNAASTLLSTTSSPVALLPTSITAIPSALSTTLISSTSIINSTEMPITSLLPIGTTMAAAISITAIIPTIKATTDLINTASQSITLTVTSIKPATAINEQLTKGSTILPSNTTSSQKLTTVSGIQTKSTQNSITNGSKITTATNSLSTRTFYTTNKITTNRLSTVLSSLHSSSSSLSFLSSKLSSLIPSNKSLTSKTSLPQSTNRTTVLPSTKANQSTITSTISTITSTSSSCNMAHWSTCSKTCGDKSTKTRQRKCDVISFNETKLCKDLPKCNPMNNAEMLIAKIISAIGCTWMLSTTSASFVANNLLKASYFETKIRMAQEFTLVSAHTLIATVATQVEKPFLCKLVAMALQYLFISYFLFIGFEACQSYYIYTNVLSSGQFVTTRIAFIAGFSIPALIVIPTAAFQYDNLTSEFSCFINLGRHVSLISIIPLILINTCTVTVLESSGMQQGKSLPLTDRMQNHSAFVSKHTVIIILPLSVASWTLMAIGLYYQELALFAIIFGLNVALGWQILLCHFLANPIVKIWFEKMRKKFRKK